MKAKQAVADVNRAIHLLQSAKADLVWKDRMDTPKVSKERAAKRIKQAIALLRPHTTVKDDE